MNVICPICSSVVPLPETQRGRPFVCAHCRRRVETPPPPLSAALTLGDFVIGDEIAKSDSGPLYRAHQTSLGRDVALKILSPGRGADDTLIRHFVSEARRLASMGHPVFVHMYAIGEEGGLYFRSTEFVDGESVAARLARCGAMSPREVVACGSALAPALQAAWDQCQLLADGLSPRDVLLTDTFARLIHAGDPLPEVGESGATGSSRLTGLVAPEMVLGGKCDVRASLYALGVLLFRMATGEAPFAGADRPADSADFLYRQAPSPRDMIPDFPEDAAVAIQRLLLREPDDRFACGADVVAALGASQETPVAVVGADNDMEGAEKWRCPACQVLNSVKGKYCRGCGAYGMEPCPSCGEGVHLGTTFCSLCGANLQANRQALREHGEQLLKKLRSCLASSDWGRTQKTLKEYASLDTSSMPDELVRAFEGEQRNAVKAAEEEARQAEERLDMAAFEATVQLLLEIGGSGDLPQKLEAEQARLADGIYQANTAYQTRCFDRSRLIIEGLRPWTGAILGERRAQLLQDSRKRLAERKAAMQRAQDLLADPEARTDALQVRGELAGFRLSKKLLVVAPSPVDVAAETAMAAVMTTIERNITTTIQALLRNDYWDSVADLLERTGDDNIHGGIVSRRTLSACVENEVDGRFMFARELEEQGAHNEARVAWQHVLDVPGLFLADHVRREALAFEQRLERKLVEERRTQIKGHVSAVFFIWCLAFALSGVNGIATWYEGLLDASTVMHSFGPLTAYLAAILVVGFLLRSRRVMGGGDHVSGRQAPLFFLGIGALWIVSPLSWIVLELNTMVCNRILDVGSDLDWVGPVVAGTLWLAADLMRCWQYPALPGAVAMTLSWLGATASMSFLLSGRSLSDSGLVLVVSSMHFVLFVAVHVAHYVLVRSLSKNRPKVRSASGSHPSPDEVQAA